MELEKDKGNLHGLTDRGMKVISKITKQKGLVLINGINGGNILDIG